MLDNTPIAIFAFDRPEHLESLILSLESNPSYDASRVVLFQDRYIDGNFNKQLFELAEQKFDTGKIILRDRHMGLYNNIVSGIDEVLQEHEELIVLEEDLEVSEGFLGFLESGLKLYSQDNRVYSIQAFMYPMNEKWQGTYLLPYPNCWGWATWKRAWKYFDYEVEQADLIKESKWLSQRFSSGAAEHANLLGNENSWAIHWRYTFLKQNALAVYPGQTLVRNTGFDGSGLHQAVYPEYKEMKIVSFQEMELKESIDLDFMHEYENHHFFNKDGADSGKRQNIFSTILKQMS